MDVQAAIKKPWVKYSLIGVAVVGGFLILKKVAGGGGGTTVVQQGTDPAAAQLQAQQNQLAAQSAAAAGAQSYNLALDAQQAAEKYQLSKLTTDASLAAQNNQTNAALSVASMQSAAALESAHLSADTARMQAQLNADTAQHVVDTQTAGQIGLAQINADNSAKQMQANVQIGANEIAGLTQLANIQSNTTIQTTALNTATQQHISDNQTAVALNSTNTAGGVASNASTDQLLGTAAMAAAMFFSDRRLKRDIVRIGTHRLGVGIYEYRYVWSKERHVGVMAQEVLAVLPAAVVRHASGFLMVDYGALEGFYYANV